MSTRLRDVELDPRWLYWSGAVLLVLAIALPPGLLYLGLANQRPPIDAAAAGVLRPEMMVLPAGEFLMGSPNDEVGRVSNERRHRVELSRPFVVSLTEVTIEQFVAVMGKAALPTKSSSDSACYPDGQDANWPAVCVSWLDAVAYANALSSREKLQPAYAIDGKSVRWNQAADGYRLPTEAQWAYAARAGSQTRFVGTDDPARACEFGNVRDQAFGQANSANAEYDFPCRDEYERLSPVKAMKPNAWGLHGFAGNASEWVWDSYAAFRPDSVKDPTGPESGVPRVIRGASWIVYRRFARVASRSRIPPGYRFDYVGFRLARSCLPSTLLPSSCFVPPAGR